MVLVKTNIYSVPTGCQEWSCVFDVYSLFYSSQQPYPVGISPYIL